jgi:microcystin-dependent protein
MRGDANATNLTSQIGGADAVGDHQHSIASAGSGSAHNNIQPSAIVKMIIKT